MADRQYFTFQPEQAEEPEVKVYEYIVPNSAVRPPYVAYPGAYRPTPMMPMRAASPAEVMFARWLHRRYGSR